MSEDQTLTQTHGLGIIGKCLKFVCVFELVHLFCVWTFNMILELNIFLVDYLNDEAGSDSCFCMEQEMIHPFRYSNDENENFMFRCLNDEIRNISYFAIWMMKHDTVPVSLFDWRNANNKTWPNFSPPALTGAARVRMW